MFPAGAAGVALLLLRLVVATTVVTEGTGRWTLVSSFWFAVPSVILAISICLGLMTPYSSILCGFLEVRSIVDARFDNLLQPLTAIMLCIILAMLGPGTYSLDSRIFGRQLLRLPSHGKIDHD
jgi:uncharacterized membrane protein YphA (DoxX/SURF4 family)